MIIARWKNRLFQVCLNCWVRTAGRQRTEAELYLVPSAERPQCWVCNRGPEETR